MLDSSDAPLSIPAHDPSASVCLPIMRPLFTRHVSHPVRSRFSAFAFSRSSLKGSERLDDDEEAASHRAKGPNLSGQTLTTDTGKSLPPEKSVDDSVSGPEEPGKEWKLTEAWERDTIKPLPRGAYSHYSSGTPEYPSKANRRKEHWEIIEELEREEQLVRKQKMDPSKWQQRKLEWERIERMQSHGKQNRRKVRSPSPRSPPSWYHGWGNRLGHGDGNQGWELELRPVDRNSAVPPLPPLPLIPDQRQKPVGKDPAAEPTRKL